MRWQKRARLGIAIFGIVFAAVVYSAIDERRAPSPVPAPQRVDPKASIETSRGVLNRTTGTKLDFMITFDRQLAYENGSAKLLGVRVEVKEKEGRDFVITSGEGMASEQQRDLQLTGNVKMAASDGFVLSTETAAFNQNEGIVRTPGPVSFSKGSMTGSGIGMTYDKNTDVLTILDKSQVRMADEGGNTTGLFTAGKGTLSRQEDYLLLEGAVHVLRGDQTLDAERMRATLTPDEKAITFIELRDKAEIVGGSSAFDTMSANEVDLDYTDDGETLERVILTGKGVIALKSQAPANSSEPIGGKQLLGESLDLALAPDGALTSAVGRGDVQLVLPAADGAPPRQVKAKTLEATGEAGKGMTSARFTDDVEYLEEARAGSAPRSAKSRALRVGLEGNAVNSAIFTGRVQFEDQALKASAAEARYEPGKGILRLKGADEGGGPRVADEQITIEADTIDVTLEGRKMIADGNVKTMLQAKAKTPGLLKQDQPTNVSATKLQYEGTPGRALYTGGAQLWQGETAIRGDSIAIDQDKGNLTATGNARSTLVLGEGASIGRGDHIRYEDAARQLSYVGRSASAGAGTKSSSTAATSGPVTDDATAAVASPNRPQAIDTKPAPGSSEKAAAPVGAAVSPIPQPATAPAQLSGPQGDLKAMRIVVHLAKTESRMERLDAYDNITLRVDTRIVSGTRLTYYTDDERYVMEGSAAAPVKILEACRETMGRTLTFFKSADRIIVDGNEEIRTRTKSDGPCPDPPSR